jgi:hypothetical protein
MNYRAVFAAPGIVEIPRSARNDGFGLYGLSLTGSLLTGLLLTAS